MNKKYSSYFMVKESCLYGCDVILTKEEFEIYKKEKILPARYLNLKKVENDKENKE